jgi:hypothetical protein
MESGPDIMMLMSARKYEYLLINEFVIGAYASEVPNDVRLITARRNLSMKQFVSGSEFLTSLALDCYANVIRGRHDDRDTDLYPCLGDPRHGRGCTLAALRTSG